MGREYSNSPSSDARGARAASPGAEPLTEIDFYRERLEGCMSCNVWITTAGARRKIPQEDIEALRGISRDVDR